MARKSRYTTINQTIFNEIPITEKIYKTAIYARLSCIDLSKDNDSIENQILLVKKYIESNPYLKLCGTFFDNGQTGTNFEREGFQNLMEAVKCGKIDCIVVKDLSRFGRDYIEAGNYLEKVFPFLRVRFISVNDGYDSHNPVKNGDNLTIILKNLINDIYAKDISKKCRSALEIKKKNGEFIGNYAAYGYLKSQEDKHKLIINEETAPIVRDIFQWKFNGMSNLQIARKLNDLRILSPSNYLYSKNLLHDKKYTQKIFWSEYQIKTMLLNIVYIGHLAQNKKSSVLNSKFKSTNHSKDNWIIVKNTHEPIIDIATFETVGKIMRDKTADYNKSQIKTEHLENVFLGLIKCGDCGKNLVRTKNKSKYGKIYLYITCPTYITYLSSGCPKKYISEEILKEAVFAAVSQQILLLYNMENEISEFNSSPEMNGKKCKLLMEQEEIEQRIIRLTSLKNSLYNDFKDKLLTENEYNYTRKKYENDGNLLSLRLNEITAELEKYGTRFLLENKYFSEFKRFSEVDELSREMLTALIDKIYVYSDNRIEINFKYMEEFEQIKKYIENSEVKA